MNVRALPRIRTTGASETAPVVRKSHSGRAGLADGGVASSIGHNSINDGSGKVADEPRVGLTVRQMALLRFITGYMDSRGGVSPSFDEMLTGIGGNSKASVHQLLAGLVERGYISRLKNRSRAVTILRNVPVPRASDGAPLYFIAFHEVQNAEPRQQCLAPKRSPYAKSCPHPDS